MSGAANDLRIAWRALRATPLVTAVAVLSLALAIGANTAIFSISNSLLIRSLPVADPDRLVYVTDSIRRPDGEIRVRAWSNPLWTQIRQRPHLFERVSAWSFTRFNLAASGETRFVDGLWADGGFFATLGVGALRGRTFSERDDRRGGGPDGPVAVISHGYWQRAFAGAADAIGRTVHLNGVAFTIVGVTPPGFFGLEVGRTFDVIVPLATEALIRTRDSVLDSAASNFLTIVARLKPGQSGESAAADLRAVQSDVRAATVGPWDKQQVDGYLASPFSVVSAATGSSLLRERFARPLLVVAGVVALVLLIGCVNVANLLLGRAIARRHELSVQIALGASRWRLARQLFAESAALAGLGAIAGVFIAAAVSRFLVAQLSTPANIVFLDLAIDGRVLAFTIAIAAVTALLFGTAPAFRAVRLQPIDAMRDHGRTMTDQRGGLMAWLVAVQVALSTVLLVGAGLFVRSFVSLADRDLGIEPARVLVATIDPLGANIEPSLRPALYERVRQAVLALPDAADAAISHVTPFGGGGFTPAIEVAAAEVRTSVDANGDVYGNLISPGWFGTFGTRVVAGRDFGDGDRRGAPGVAIVNEAFVRRFLSNAALGSSITIYPNSPRALRMEIVGVVEDAVYSSPRDAAPPTWYLPMAQFDVPGFGFSSARLSVRARSGAPASLADSVAGAAVNVHPQLALTSRVLAEQVRGALTLDRLMAQLAGFFGVLALLLAALGLYGVTAYAISRRRAEIGIRIALGAAPADVIRLVLTRVVVLMTTGLVAGVVISLWAAKFVAGLLYGLPPRDPATLVSAALVLLTIGIVASSLPMRRAIRTDPTAVLREL